MSANSSHDEIEAVSVDEFKPILRSERQLANRMSETSVDYMMMTGLVQQSTRLSVTSA
jgi:hypothetical protein